MTDPVRKAVEYLKAFAMMVGGDEGHGALDCAEALAALDEPVPEPTKQGRLVHTAAVLAHKLGHVGVHPLNEKWADAAESVAKARASLIAALAAMESIAAPVPLQGCNELPGEGSPDPRLTTVLEAIGEYGKAHGQCPGAVEGLCGHPNCAYCRLVKVATDVAFGLDEPKALLP